MHERQARPLSGLTRARPLGRCSRRAQRHDGQAVTCDDFLAAMADANGADLSQMQLWCGLRVRVRVRMGGGGGGAAGVPAVRGD